MPGVESTRPQLSPNGSTHMFRDSPDELTGPNPNKPTRMYREDPGHPEPETSRPISAAAALET